MMQQIGLFVLSFLILSGCSDDTNELVSGNTRPQWLVPKDEVFDSGVGQDGIPSIDAPQFDLITDVNPAFDEQLVIGLSHNGELKGYPIPIMDWHEVVNDVIGDLNIAITYCPLTGTAIGWNRKFGSAITTFGVSGLLFNSNLMPYDRRSNSIWSQLSLECVNGPRRGEVPETFTLIETTLATWRKSFPKAKIMNANTGFDRTYSFYPYGGYRTNDDTFFPISQTDNRLPLKERVLGVTDGEEVMAFRFNKKGEGAHVIHYDNSIPSIVVVMSADDNYNTAFTNSQNKIFTAVQNALPAIMKDENENFYNLNGKVIDGPDEGSQLERPTAFIGYWFSWASFYPNINIYEK